MEIMIQINLKTNKRIKADTIQPYCIQQDSEYGKIWMQSLTIGQTRVIDSELLTVNIEEYLLKEDGTRYSDYLLTKIGGVYAPDLVMITIKTKKALIQEYKGYYTEVIANKLTELDYDSITTVKLWENDDIFGVEATKILNWYKAIIAKNYEILKNVKNEVIILPTKEEYLLMLPEYVTEVI